MKFKKSREGKAINHYLDALQEKYSAYIFNRRVPLVPVNPPNPNSPNARWAAIWTKQVYISTNPNIPIPKYYTVSCHHYDNRTLHNRSCVCEQQGRRKLYRLIKYCFQAKATLADLLHYAIWHTHLSDQQFIMIDFIEVIKKLRAACPNPGNLV